jgi:hypothetical protein
VIFLENSNDWNISPAKEEFSKKEKKEEQGLKSKRGEISFEKLHVSKRERERERMRFTSYWERFYQKKERRSHFPIVQNLMCGIIHTHTSFAFALPSIP